MARSFNPFDPEQAHNAWPLLAELREESAVVDIGDGMAYVTRHAECRQLLRDTDGFSSAQGFKAPGVVVPIEDRTLGELDPPNHTLVRRVMVTALTPKSVKVAEPYIAATAERLLDALPDDGEVDLVPAFTAPLPNASTVHVLGFPEADVPRLMHWAKDLIESGFPGTHRNREGVEGFKEGFPDFVDYIDARIEERRSEPRDDVTTKLLELEVEGVRLTPRQLRADGAQPDHRRVDDDEPAPRKPALRGLHGRRPRGAPPVERRRDAAARSRRACDSHHPSCSSRGGCRRDTEVDGRGLCTTASVS